MAISGAALIAAPYAYGRYQEWQEDREFRQPVHPGNTTISSGITRQTKKPTTMEIRHFNGEVVWVEGDAEETAEQINIVLARLEKVRSLIKETASRDIDNAFKVAFASRESDINRFADWHFAWNGKYRYLLSAGEGMANAALALDLSDLGGEGEQAIANYFFENYIEFVLRPEIREPLLRSNLNGAMNESHQRFVIELEVLDSQLRSYLERKTTHIDNIGNQSLQEIKPDWDTEKWKAPDRIAIDDAGRALPSAALTLAAGAVSYEVLGPIVITALSDVLSGITSSLLASLGTEIAAMEAGGLIGSIEPGAGTALGAIVGVVGAGVWEIFSSEYHEASNRPAFERRINEGLDATIGIWQEEAENAVHEAIDIWFDDARNIVAQKNLTGA